MKKAVNIICVGKIKTPHWQSAAQDYLQRLKRSWQIQLIATREADEPAPEERNRREGVYLLNALAQTAPAIALRIALDEGGDVCGSADFSAFLLNCWERENRAPCFIIGGPYGLSPEVIQKADKVLSLGPMTFPHELALVLLLEQLYRADSIMRGAPYHHL